MNSNLFFLVASAAFGLSSCATLENKQVTCGTINNCRPFRTEVIKFSDELDTVKPLAPIDVSGWTLASGILVGTFDDRWLAGVSIKDRKVLWWHEVKSGVTSPISVLGSWIIIGQRDGSVTKLEASTGKKVWEAQFGKFAARSFALGGSIIVGVSANQQVYGVDFQSGKILWLYDAGEPDNLAIRSSAPPIIRERQVLLGTDKGEIHAIALDTGKLEWRSNPFYSENRFHDTVGEMVVSGNQLVMTRYDGLLGAMNLQSSDHGLTWKENLPTITQSSYRNGILFVGCLNGDVYAVEANSGRRLWRATTYKSVSTLSAGEKFLYVGGSNGRITAIDITTGESLWQDDVDGAIDAPPVVIGDNIYFATGLKVLYGYRLM